ncbi:hypothetical protein BV898_02359 [Hypsibius exemplaris]|uniref:Uncharacterized protein n=1 Tax=Hypsibius exemplaris TaxID=2072580 RepID=A0A1W0X881_HYPEX|nr:hypothetical protein BV898_02359 [Hypsibius exemplaris]
MSLKAKQVTKGAALTTTAIVGGVELVIAAPVVVAGAAVAAAGVFLLVVDSVDLQLATHKSRHLLEEKSFCFFRLSNPVYPLWLLCRKEVVKSQ